MWRVHADYGLPESTGCCIAEQQHTNTHSMGRKTNRTKESGKTGKAVTLGKNPLFIALKSGAKTAKNGNSNSNGKGDNNNASMLANNELSKRLNGKSSTSTTSSSSKKTKTENSPKKTSNGLAVALGLAKKLKSSSDNNGTTSKRNPTGDDVPIRSSIGGRLAAREKERERRRARDLDQRDRDRERDRRDRDRRDRDRDGDYDRRDSSRRSRDDVDRGRSRRDHDREIDRRIRDQERDRRDRDRNLDDRRDGNSSRGRDRVNGSTPTGLQQQQRKNNNRNKPNVPIDLNFKNASLIPFLRIENLTDDVSEADVMMVLSSKLGQVLKILKMKSTYLKKPAVTAEVFFMEEDKLSDYVKKLDGVKADGRVLKVSIDYHSKIINSDRLWDNVLKEVRLVRQRVIKQMSERDAAADDAQMS